MLYDINFVLISIHNICSPHSLYLMHRIVELLLQKFPDCINSKDGYGYTILHCAALQDHLNIITLAMEEVWTELLVQSS